MAELTLAQKKKMIAALKKASKTHTAQAAMIEKTLPKAKTARKKR